MKDDICIICLENIKNEFCILNCHCKNQYFHNKCINELINFSRFNKFSCPLCRYKFPRKPRFNKFNNRYISSTPTSVFAINYNILRIISGYSGLSYSS